MRKEGEKKTNNYRLKTIVYLVKIKQSKKLKCLE